MQTAEPDPSPAAAPPESTAGGIGERPAEMTTGEVLRFGSVRALMVANTVLYTGVALQAAALGKQAYDITGRSADLGWIGLCEFLPAALLVLVTGTVADRFNRKRVALIAISGEVLTSVALLVFALSGPTEVWPLFIIAFFYGIARAFLAPAIRTMPPMVAPDGGLPRVIALYSATWTAAMIVGPAVSGFLYAVDPWVAYAASGSLIFASIFFIGALKFERQPDPPDPDEKPTFRSAVEGLLFIRRTPTIQAIRPVKNIPAMYGMLI